MGGEHEKWKYKKYRLHQNNARSELKALQTFQFLKLNFWNLHKIASHCKTMVS